MEIRENIKVYHCNDKQRCEKFLKEDNYLIWSEEEGIWLGSGMYFWDNLANAQYWKGQKKRKTNNRKPLSIVCSNIYIDNFLDLTDIDNCYIIEKLWENYCNMMKKSYEYYKNVELGGKLNILFRSKVTREYFSKYNVIKVIGNYPYTQPSPLFYYDVNNKKPQPTLSAKCIYNVKNPDCIFNKKLVEE